MRSLDSQIADSICVSCHVAVKIMRDNHTPARGILDMCTGQGLYTYSGGRGMGCDYNIIVHLEKFSHFPLKMASFNCKFSRNSTEVAKWVIVILCGPRACTRSCAALGRKSLVQEETGGTRGSCTRYFRPRAAQDLVPPGKRRCRRPTRHRRLPGQITQMCRLVAKEENFSKWSIMKIISS